MHNGSIIDFSRQPNREYRLDQEDRLEQQTINSFAGSGQHYFAISGCGKIHPPWSKVTNRDQVFRQQVGFFSEGCQLFPDPLK
jgi:hypothetical protein